MRLYAFVNDHESARLCLERIIFIRSQFLSEHSQHEAPFNNLIDRIQLASFQAQSGYKEQAIATLS
jgi:hypothetical protein